jgi:stress-induced-phosphoprotein 1
MNNKAAVYFEMKDYQKCIEECDKAIEKSKGGHYDYVKLGKALARKANAKLQL